MRLLPYELKKLARGRVLPILLLLSFGLSALLFVSRCEQDPDAKVKPQLTVILKLVAAMPEEEAGEWLLQKSREFTIRETCLSVQDPELRDLLLADYREEDPKAYDRAVYGAKTWPLELTEKWNRAYYQLASQTRYFEAYPDFLATIRENAEKQQSFSIFSKTGGFNTANTLKTASDYQKLEGIRLSYGPTEGITAATSFTMGDCVMLLFLFAVCVVLFRSEAADGSYLLLKSCAAGRRELIEAKLAALLLVTAGLTVLYGAMLLSLGAGIYGLGELGRSLQSLEAMRNSALLLTVGQYLLLAFLTKGLVWLALGAFFALALVSLRRSALLSLGVSLLLPLAFMLLYRAVPANAAANHLKYLNPFYVMDSLTFFGSYVNLNCFGKAVGAHWVLLPLGLALLLSAAFTVRCFVGQRAVSAYARGAAGQKLRGWLSGHWRYNGSLWRSEGRRHFLLGPLGMLLIISFCLSLYLASGYRNPAYNAEESAYRSAIQPLTGPVDDSTRNSIQFKQYLAEQYLTANEELNRQYEAGSITREQLESESSRNQTLYANKMLGMDSLLADLDYADRMLLTAGAEPYLQDQLQAKGWFANSYMSLKYGLIYLTAALTGLSFFFSADFKTGSFRLLGSTVKGRRRLLSVRYGWTALYLLLLYPAVYGPYYGFLLRAYGLPVLQAPVQSLQLYAAFPWKISVLAFLLGSILLTLLGLMAAACLVHAVTVLVKNQLAALSLCLILLCLPLMLQLQGVNVRWISLTNLFLLFESGADSGGLKYSLLHLAAVCVIGLLSVLYVGEVYTRAGKTKRWLRR